MKTRSFRSWMICLLVSATLMNCDSKGSQPLPDFNILLLDSTTIFNTRQIPKGNAFVLMYFSPDCEHCQEGTEALLKNINQVKDIKFYYITNDSFDQLRTFEKHYNLSRFSNFVLSKDYSFSFIKHFRPKGTPFAAIYDGQKTLRAVFEGEVKFDDLMSILSSIKAS